eukprot:scaffold13350_cov121-Amphora_coffeaeformis.AAC.1
MLGLYLFDKTPILDEIDVCRKGTRRDGCRQWLLTAIECDDLFWLCHDFLGQCMFDGIPGNDHDVLWIGRPTIKQLSRDTGLQHARRGKHHGGLRVIKGIDINGL